MTDAEMSACFDAASAQAKAAGGLRQSSVPVQVALMVITAQGIIDNGGLQYFYEVDFEEQGPYEEFVEAFRAIGAEDVAELIGRSIRLFPFSSPHLYEAKRQQWLGKVSDEEGHEFHQLSEKLIGYKGIEPKLKAYLSAHRSYFNAV